MPKRLLVSLLLLPSLALAQRFERGSYQLATGQWQTAELRLRDESALVVKDVTGTKITFTPEQVLAMHIGSRHYGVELVEVTEGLFGIAMRPRFVTVLDSGRVLLTHYEHKGGNTYTQFLLLRGPHEPQATPLHFNAVDICSELPSLLSSYLTDRPDLLLLLQQRKLTSRELLALVRALNSGQPFIQPKVPPPFGVD